MDIVSLVLLACALGMDAFAVAICKGLSVKQIKIKHYFIVAAYFGGFQALMPLIGYMLGAVLTAYVQLYSHYVAFALIVFIGLKMIKDSFNTSYALEANPFSVGNMLPLAIATSIDALAAGFSLALLNNHLILSVLVIGIITALLSMLGLRIGRIKKLGEWFGNKASFVGGIVLILISAKILFEHL
ncbi:manganese efflux pump [Helicobacter jaachi]|uniref:Putative manganese efflux pump MntP n=1 Tax=Helicobacter jaachi TaxID=1677920 RepID=A0A4U8T8P6_9HELI|nr:manganese efflux pump MntP family protein [Helicobacter jaachi]TLD96086.1 manganese efflux pump [Helicobacter jaachi]